MKNHYCPVEKIKISYEKKCNWCGEIEISINGLAEILLDKQKEVIQLQIECIALLEKDLAKIRGEA